MKGSYIIAAQSTAVGDHETEEDSGLKCNEEKEAKYSAEEDVGMSGEVGNVDPSFGYIMQFANAVELYQKKNCNSIELGVAAQIT